MISKSVFYKEYPQMWLPDPLRSPMTIKIWWYRRLWNATLGRLFSAIGGLFKKAEEPEEVIELRSQSPVLEIDVDVKADG